jgi:superfamily II DNA/RNA helicase
MFDPRTAELLQSAPGVPGLAADDLPKALTRAYARLVSDRLEGGGGELDVDDPWSVDRIADTYEIIASLEQNAALKRAAAFVAGTAQQIIARRAPAADRMVQLPVDRDGVDASVAAALLFLAAEQYGDANEAAAAITIPQRGMRQSRELGRHVRDLARGNLTAILDRAGGEPVPPPPAAGRLERDALRRLLDALARGVEHLAAHLLSPSEAPLDELGAARALFSRVLELSADRRDPDVEWTSDGEDSLGDLSTRYAGPAHLASLLLTATGGITDAALSRLPAPDGADGAFWAEWLRYRAESMPYVWRNHREAIAAGFHEPGRSAVLVLPTGAGKTTVSALKIAGTLARGRKVVFLAPTHALVEQLTDDLQALFPDERFGLAVSGDFGSLLLEDAQLQDIEVMTPERCLAMLSFAPEAFAQVGLLVFDECHLLSPSRRIGRALDSMLCVLAFHAAAPDADLLMLSAMLRNGSELAAWVANLTGRACESVELLWKPSRQARGVVVYHQRKIERIEASALRVQRDLNRRAGRASGSLRAAAERELSARPWVLWGLQHNWSEVDDGYTHTRVTEGALPLTGRLGRDGIGVRPNANKTAASIGLNAVRAGLKTIIFVNTKRDAIGTASFIDAGLEPVTLDADERALLDALEIELGDRSHAVFGNGGFAAVPHNGAMLMLERRLAERLFRRKSGAKVIVATPTLAQGLNLPAELAILAGDKRSGSDGEREDLEAHELLNAAGRAGRAGHLANGVVILIPEPIITFRPRRNLPRRVVAKLRSVLPEDDRCIVLADPLEIVLDRVMAGDLADRDVRYTVNRLVALTAADQAIAPDNLLVRSFAAFRARQRGDEAAYMAKVGVLWDAAREAIDDGAEPAVMLLASQSGMEMGLLDRLRVRLLGDADDLPSTIPAWVDWILDWLAADGSARSDLLSDTARGVNASLGRGAELPLTGATMQALKPAARAWLEGRPLNEVETLLGGAPNGATASQRQLPRAREFVSSVVPRSLSFLAGVVARMVQELGLADDDADMDASVLRALSGAVRRGFDTVAKLEFANANRRLMGRVATHLAYDEAADD